MCCPVLVKDTRIQMIIFTTKWAPAASTSPAGRMGFRSTAQRWKCRGVGWLCLWANMWNCPRSQTYREIGSEATDFQVKIFKHFLTKKHQNSQFHVFSVCCFFVEHPGLQLRSSYLAMAMTIHLEMMWTWMDSWGKSQFWDLQWSLLTDTTSQHGSTGGLPIWKSTHVSYSNFASDWQHCCSHWQLGVICFLAPTTAHPFFS